jgi:hypothetical protein
MDGDLEDLESAFVGNARQRHRYDGTPGLRCSMLAKLTADKKDLVFAHATWDSFSNMAPRIYKTYHLPGACLDSSSAMCVCAGVQVWVGGCINLYQSGIVLVCVCVPMAVRAI